MAESPELAADAHYLFRRAASIAGQGLCTQAHGDAYQPPLNTVHRKYKSSPWAPWVFARLIGSYPGRVAQSRLRGQLEHSQDPKIDVLARDLDNTSTYQYYKSVGSCRLWPAKGRSAPGRYVTRENPIKESSYWFRIQLGPVKSWLSQGTDARSWVPRWLHSEQMVLVYFGSKRSNEMKTGLRKGNQARQRKKKVSFAS